MLHRPGCFDRPGRSSPTPSSRCPAPGFLPPFARRPERRRDRWRERRLRIGWAWSCPSRMMMCAVFACRRRSEIRTVGGMRHIPLRLKNRQAGRQGLRDRGMGGAAERQAERRRRAVGRGDDRRHGSRRIPLQHETAVADRAPQGADGGLLVDRHRVGADEVGREARVRRAGLRDDEGDAEGRHLLRDGLNEPFDAPFGGVIEAEAGIGDLPALGGHLHDASPSLPPKMGQRGADQVDGAGEVGGDLPVDLRLREFLGRAEQAVAGVADDHVDPVVPLKGAADGRFNAGRVREIERNDLKATTMLPLQVGQRFRAARRGEHPVVPGEQLPRHVKAKARRRAGDEPCFRHADSSSSVLLPCGSGPLVR
ncbi:protein of unknown function (plasmid) [Azospirillum baldaniorum]|uniref:Uncharacterized protein n=1 Tax=Azospirillum baldaniorum TaxID=1064539 RepID=A0A9P1NR75_9PROT|nr:protein of unknown function [Azospirillum baldaniorum]